MSRETEKMTLRKISILKFWFGKLKIFKKRGPSDLINYPFFGFPGHFWKKSDDVVENPNFLKYLGKKFESNQLSKLDFCIDFKFMSGILVSEYQMRISGNKPGHGHLHPFDIEVN